MRRIQVLFLAAVFASASAGALAETPSEDFQTPSADDGDSVAGEGAVPAPSDEAVGELAWDQFDDPELDPSTSPAPNPTLPALADSSSSESVVAAPEASEVASQSGIQLTGEAEFGISEGTILGPVGVDDLGRTGRLHTVASGDTLWDLAAAYLGTPWVWPSVWIDNDDIENPHRINPGDKIWITANEMRVVSDAQAESFLDPTPASPSEGTAATAGAIDGGDDFAASAEAELISPVAALEGESDELATLEAFPVSVVGQEPGSIVSGRQITISQRDAMGFVSSEDLAGASSIVDSPIERTYLAAGDPVVIGMGEGDVEVGDQFTIFRVVEQVRDVETNRILGHHVDVLGWVEVRTLTGDTSIAEIRTSYAEMRRGVRVMPRKRIERHVTAQTTPDAIEGKVIFLPGERTVMADGDYVYLNRGEFHGVEVGSELEVYEPGLVINDRPRRVDVRTPDHCVARLIVVSVTSDSSVAFVLTSTRELVVGDDVRPVVTRLAQR